MDEWWLEPLRRVFGGRRVVLAGGPAAAWTDHIATLRSAGVSDLLVVASRVGAGALPDVPCVIVAGPTGLSIMEGIRHDNAFLTDPPDEVLTALDEFDPGVDAIVLGSFLNTTSHLAGRPFASYRRPEWVALEDKVVIDAFWDRAGIDRQPSVVVPLADAPSASTSLDRGDGTVWAADAREGFHGGATQTYWVADDTGLADARSRLEQVCDRVRIMPFLDGIPCSIHGIVLPDGVVTLRPVEMVTLRRGHELVYAGCATFWDPPEEVRAQMRSITRKVGARLADEVGFRGTFTVDGVAADDGFWPTELNPRFGAGINTIARAAGLPILLVNDLAIGGHGLGRSAADIETELLTIADSRRGGGTWMAGLEQVLEVNERPVALGSNGDWRWADAPSDRPILGTVTAGSGFVRCTYDHAATAVGPATAPLACAFWSFVDREAGTALGPLTPAPDRGR